MTTDNKPIIEPMPRYKLLIEEYKICHDYASHMNSMTWQMAAVLLPGSFVSLAYLSSRSESGSNQQLIILIVSFMAIGILIIWSYIFKRWFFYQQIAYHRMAEIESELGLRLISYGQAMRSGNFNEETKHIQSLCKECPRHSARTLVIILTRLLIILWLLFVIFTFFYMPVTKYTTALQEIDVINLDYQMKITESKVSEMDIMKLNSIIKSSNKDFLQIPLSISYRR